MLLLSDCVLCGKFPSENVSWAGLVAELDVWMPKSRLATEVVTWRVGSGAGQGSNDLRRGVK